MVKMCNLSNGDFILYNLAVEPESQSNLVKLRTFEKAVNNLGIYFMNGGAKTHILI